MSAARTEAKEGGGWLGVYVLAYLVFLYLPISLIPLFSFNDSIQAAFPLQGFTLAMVRRRCTAIRRCPARSPTAWSIGVAAATGATLCGITDRLHGPLWPLAACRHRSAPSPACRS